MERATPQRNLRCTICGLVIPVSAPPEHCPECGARGPMFEPTDEPPREIPHNPLLPRDPHEQAGVVVAPGDSGCLKSD